MNAAARKSSPQPKVNQPTSAAQSARERFTEAVRNGGGSRVVAAQLGVSRSYVDMIIGGQRRPGMVTALAIQHAFGIQMQDWVEPGTPAGRPRRAAREA